MKNEDEGGAPLGSSVHSSEMRGSAGSSNENGSRAAQGRHAGDEPASDLKPVSADMQQFIGRQLRAVFDDVAKQPVPDRFLELMRQLDNKASAR